MESARSRDGSGYFPNRLIRLGTAAFPETGQKRLVLLSDGNENIGDAGAAVLAARSLGVTLDVLPLGVQHGGDVSVQKLATPGQVKKGTTFEAKIFVNSDQARTAAVRIYRNEQYLAEKEVELAAGKNLFTFPQTLNDPGFHTYRVVVEAPGDTVPQNNVASSFTSVKGDHSPPATLQVELRATASRVRISDLGASDFRLRIPPVLSADRIHPRLLPLFVFLPSRGLVLIGAL